MPQADGPNRVSLCEVGANGFSAVLERVAERQNQFRHVIHLYSFFCGSVSKLEREPGCGFAFLRIVK